jgi:hypothetical protein
MNRLFRQAAGAWNRLLPAERHQLAGAACFLIALCYGLLLWQPGNKQLGDLIYKEQKQNVRNRAINKGGNDAALQNLNLDGFDIQVTRRELARVRESLAALEAERARLLARFVPLDDLETLQALKSELARLAESGDMEVTALEHIYSNRAGNDDQPPTPDLLKKASESSPYKRPLLRLRGRASYRGLMEFLDGLSSLSRVAAPVWSNITVKTENPRRDNTLANNSVARQWLEVEMHLAI